MCKRCDFQQRFVNGEGSLESCNNHVIIHVVEDYLAVKLAC